MSSDIDWPASATAAALRERRVSFSVVIKFAAAVAIVVGNINLAHNWAQATTDAQSRLVHTRDAAAALDAVFDAIKDLDRTNARYLLSLAPSDLSARDAAIAAVNDGLPRLRELMADDPAQHQRSTELQPLITDYASCLRDEQTSPSHARMVATESLADQICARFAELRRDEGRLLAQRQADLQQSIDSQPSDFLGLLLLTSVSLCVCYAWASAYIRRREEAGSVLLHASRRAAGARSVGTTLSERMCCDIRSALTAIIGFCDLPPESETTRENRFDSIRRQARRIVDAIDRNADAHLVSDAHSPPDVPAASRMFRTDTVSPNTDASSSLPTTPFPAPAFTGRVLLAEDDPDLQKVIKFYLAEAGANVTTVPDGQLAYDQATLAWKQKEPFDLILMDVQMPKSDGRSATIRLRDSGYTNPIVALTANDTEEERNRCFAAGCNGFLAKPVEKQEFHQTMRRYLRCKGDSCAVPAEPVSEQPDGASADPQFAALRESFEAELPSRLFDIGSAVVAGDLIRVSDLSHQLKGTAGCFGLTSIYDSAAALQAAAELPELRETIQKCFEALTESVQSRKSIESAPQSLVMSSPSNI